VFIPLVFCNFPKSLNNFILSFRFIPTPVSCTLMTNLSLVGCLLGILLMHGSSQTVSLLCWCGLINYQWMMSQNQNFLAFEWLVYGPSYQSQKSLAELRLEPCHRLLWTWERCFTDSLELVWFSLHRLRSCNLKFVHLVVSGSQWIWLAVECSVSQLCTFVSRLCLL